ncbi:hypothetical protein [Paenibacillus mucilaginosus]|uniref:Uncharacterized protein n=1 Tax=Paenibacillus mucilaginosus (strain KNP414) TaxID=1036673 RepID=F8F5F8_PAEMK|nr:hypothetical protein [Paenibacillus mucilaginosus]AEI40969.1 hypothetical protein KNP414_02408 [Paenibacillus mucilaginosus KNP414]MCG7211585.1 hypothetical protein [Paenibacillus mucilaginosus]WDM30048.1 hypothetical protein KCX80_13265 [Paenibacillus mucilaginosus]
MVDIQLNLLNKTDSPWTFVLFRKAADGSPFSDHPIAWYVLPLNAGQEKTIFYSIQTSLGVDTAVQPGDGAQAQPEAKLYVMYTNELQPGEELPPFEESNAAEIDLTGLTGADITLEVFSGEKRWHVVTHPTG